MRRTLWKIGTAALAAALLASCGYRLGPTNGAIAGDRSVDVKVFVNKTLEPHLSDYVMNSVRKRLQEDGTYKVNTHENGDIVLSGVITSYERTPLAFQPTDVITVVDYEMSMVAEVTAQERSTGKLIFKKTLRGRTSLQVGTDLTSAERAAMPLLTDDLAKKAVAMLVDGNW